MKILEDISKSDESSRQQHDLDRAVEMLNAQSGVQNLIERFNEVQSGPPQAANPSELRSIHPNHYPHRGVQNLNVFLAETFIGHSESLPDSTDLELKSSNNGFNERVFFQLFSFASELTQGEHRILTRSDPEFNSTDMDVARQTEWRNFCNHEVFGSVIHESEARKTGKVLPPVVVSSVKDGWKYKCRIAIDGSRLRSSLDLQQVPLTHESKRLLTFLGLSRGLQVGTVDAISGYLQSKRKSKENFL